MVSCFVCCYRSIGRLACRLVCLLSGLSVGRSNHPTYHWLTGHPSIYLIANLPTIGTGVRRIPISSVRLAAVGLPGPCLQVAGQIWGVFHLDSQRDIPSSSIPGYIWVDSLRSVWLALPCHVSVYILYISILYTAQSASYPLLVMD